MALDVCANEGHVFRLERFLGFGCDGFSFFIAFIVCFGHCCKDIA
jgi:hypothetical protein